MKLGKNQRDLAKYLLSKHHRAFVPVKAAQFERIASVWVKDGYCELNGYNAPGLYRLTSVGRDSLSEALSKRTGE